jgi:hypothetical protein
MLKGADPEEELRGDPEVEGKEGVLDEAAGFLELVGGALGHGFLLARRVEDAGAERYDLGHGVFGAKVEAGKRGFC